MTSDSWLRDRLDAWRKSVAEGRELSAEELCADRPELAPELQRQIEALRSPDDHSTGPRGFGSTFPQPPTDDTRPRAAADPPPAALPDLTAYGYEILRELGRGGMGVVYLARRHTGEEVALKMFHRRRDTEYLDRFKREFRSVADLTHPNLIPLWELVSDGETCFFTMQHLDGRDLSACLSPVPAGGSAGGWERVRRVLGELASGLAALHAAKVLHRDVKPSNVMVTPDRVVLLDFGLAKRVDDDSGKTGTGVVLGTPAYMAPEQAAGGKALGPAADWFAFGVIVYQMLTGRLPHTGTAEEILDAKQKWAADPPPPAHLRPDVPDDLNRLCVDLLVYEPHRRPTGADVLRRLGRTEVDRVTDAELVGRDDQLAALDRAFALLDGGGTVCVRLHGLSGSGKSALAQQFLARAAADGAVVFRGRCYEQMLVPYKAFDGVIDSLVRYLRRLPDVDAAALLPRQAWAVVKLFPALAQVPPFAAAARTGPDVPDQREVRRRGAEALRELFARLGDRRRVVVFIDDLHWGDADSGVLLDEVLRTPDAPRLLLLLCYRSVDAEVGSLQQTVAGLGPAPGLAVIDVPVGDLTDADARALAAALLGAADERNEMIAREAGGNPLYIRTLVQAVRDGTAIGSDLSLTTVLWDIIRKRTPDERLLLELMSVAGRPIRPEVARPALEAARPAADPKLDFYAVQVGLRAGQLLRGTGDDRIAPHHDRVRETVLAHLPADGRRDHHLRLARATEAAGELDPEFLAVHFHGGGEHQTAAGYYAHAAEVAAGKTAFDRAAELYRLAVELGDWPTDERAKLKAGEAAALVNAGRGKEAAEAYLAAAELVERRQAIEWKRRAAEQYLISGHMDVGLSTVKEVLAAVGISYPESKFRALLGLVVRRIQLRLRGISFRPRPASEIPPEQLLRADVCITVACGLSLIDFLRGDYFQARNMLLLLRAGEPTRLPRTLALEGVLAAKGGPSAYARSERILAAARATAERTGTPYDRAVADLGSGYRDFLVGRFRSGSALLRPAEHVLLSACTAVTWELNTARFVSLFCHYFLGEWAVLVDRVPDLMNDARARGDLFAEVTLGAFAAPVARLVTDDPDRAWGELHSLPAKWTTHGVHFQHQNMLFATMLIHLYRGDGSAGWDCISKQLARFRWTGILSVRCGWTETLELRARAALVAARTAAKPESFLRSAEKDARKLSRESAEWGRALGALMTACVQASRKPDGGPELFAEAVRQLEAADLGAFAAAAKYRVGERTVGEKGEQLREEAVQWLKNQRVVNPLRIIKSYAPIGRPEDRPE